MSCPHCADRSNSALARRTRVLQLPALIEHPDALPRETALWIAGELLRRLGDDEPLPLAGDAGVASESEDVGLYGTGDPALRIGVEALFASAGAWICRPDAGIPA